DRVCIRNSDLEQRAIQSWSTCRGGSHWGRRSVPTSWSTGFRPLPLSLPPPRELLMSAVALAILLVTVLSLVRLRWGETQMTQVQTPTTVHDQPWERISPAVPSPQPATREPDRSQIARYRRLPLRTQSEDRLLAKSLAGHDIQTKIGVP